MWRFMLLAGVILMLVLALGGCSGGSNTASPSVDAEATLPAAVWFPLKVGNSWTYQVSKDTSVTDPALGPNFVLTGTGTMTVPKAVSQSGLTWFDMHFAAPLIGSYDALARQDASGLVGKDMPVAAAKEYAIKAPIVVGTAWNGAKTTTKCKIMSVTKTRTVPAGTFKNCLVVRMNDTASGFITTVTYAKNVGKIYVLVTKGTKTAGSWALKSYKLK